MANFEERFSKSTKKTNKDSKMLNNNFTENLVYEEPILKNEKSSDSVETEVLFKSGIEDIKISDNITITEEVLEFAMPEKPESVCEEVLFSDEGEELSILDSDLSIIENTIVSEDMKTSLLKNNVEEIVATETADYQLNFGDLQDIDSSFSDTLPEFTPITKYKKKNFVEKILEAEPIILQRYIELKNLILSYKKIKSRISNTADTFNVGRQQLIKLSVSGKSLKLYLCLDVLELDSKFNIKDASETKAYEQVPAFLKIRSERAMKYAKILIGMVMDKHQLEQNPKAVKIDAKKLLLEKLEN